MTPVVPLLAGGTPSAWRSASPAHPRRPRPRPPVDPSRAAAACLDRRDLDGYAALFAEAAALEDVHARYRARTRLVEAALRAGQAARPRARPGDLPRRRASDDRAAGGGAARADAAQLRGRRCCTSCGALDAAARAVRGRAPARPGAGERRAQPRRGRAAAARPAAPPAFPRAIARRAGRARPSAPRRAADRAQPAEGLRLSASA